MILTHGYLGGHENRPSKASQILANWSISLHALLMYYSYHDLLPVITKPTRITRITNILQH